MPRAIDKDLVLAPQHIKKETLSIHQLLPSIRPDDLVNALTYSGAKDGACCGDPQRATSQTQCARTPQPVNLMRSNRSLILALEQITESANAILEVLSTIDLTTVAVTLATCDGDLPRAVMALNNLHLRRGKQTLEPIQTC